MSRPTLRCGECSLLTNECADGWGWCPISDHSVHCEDVCYLDREYLHPEEIAKGLHIYQKWRRGGKGKMPPPYVIGVLIDGAIHQLRKK